jgi:hypothetical protein
MIPIVHLQAREQANLKDTSPTIGEVIGEVIGNLI